MNVSHPFANKEQIRMKELQGQRFLHREKGSTTRSAFEEALVRSDVSVDTVMEMGSHEAVWLAVKRGIGIGIVSDVEFNDHPNLCTVRISCADIFTTAHVVCLTDRKESKIIEIFFKIAAEIQYNYAHFSL